MQQVNILKLNCKLIKIKHLIKNNYVVITNNLIINIDLVEDKNNVKF